MENNILKEPNFVEELLTIFRSDIPAGELNEKISDYHDNDIAGALEQMTPEERQKLYPVLGSEKVSEIFTYIEDVDKYIGELNIEKAAKVMENLYPDQNIHTLIHGVLSRKMQILPMITKALEN